MTSITAPLPTHPHMHTYRREVQETHTLTDRIYKYVYHMSPPAAYTRIIIFRYTEMQIPFLSATTCLHVCYTCMFEMTLNFPLHNQKQIQFADCFDISLSDTEIGILSTSPVTSHQANIHPDMPGRRSLANLKANFFEQFTMLMVKSIYSSTSNK